MRTLKLLAGGQQSQTAQYAQKRDDLMNTTNPAFSGDLTITLALFDPVKFIGEGWKLIPEEHDSRNDRLKTVKFSEVQFVHTLVDGEQKIHGEENLKRLKSGSDICHGAATFMGLWDDLRVRQENCVLEILFHTLGIRFIAFCGDVLLDPNGCRRLLYFYRTDAGQWRWSYYLLLHPWSRDDVVAVSQVPTK